MHDEEDEEEEERLSYANHGTTSLSRLYSPMPSRSLNCHPHMRLTPIPLQTLTILLVVS